MRVNDKIIYLIYHNAGMYTTKELNPLARIFMGLGMDFVPSAVGIRGKKNNQSVKRYDP